eukprot:4846483-Pyramimonas_sp.AAC.1
MNAGRGSTHQRAISTSFNSWQEIHAHKFSLAGHTPALHIEMGLIAPPPHAPPPDPAPPAPSAAVPPPPPPSLQALSAKPMHCAR